MKFWRRVAFWYFFRIGDGVEILYRDGTKIQGVLQEKQWSIIYLVCGMTGKHDFFAQTYRYIDLCNPGIEKIAKVKASSIKS